MLTRVHIASFELVLLNLFCYVSFISRKSLLVLSQGSFPDTQLDYIILLRIRIFHITFTRWFILIYLIINTRLILNLNELFLRLSNRIWNPHNAITLDPNLIIFSIIWINKGFVPLWRVALFWWFRFLFFPWKPFFL
jgi:hypothetical protein